MEDWPQEVALPQSAFTPRPPKPIENLVPDMDEQGRALLMVPNKFMMLFSNLTTIVNTGSLTSCGFSSLSAIPRLQPLQEDIGLCCAEPPVFPKRGQPQ